MKTLLNVLIMMVIVFVGAYVIGQLLGKKETGKTAVGSRWKEVVTQPITTQKNNEPTTALKKFDQNTRE